MKINALVAAAFLFAGMTSGAYAECDTHKGDRDTDKQTKCSEKCEDGYTGGIQVYNANKAKITENTVACFEQCGCAAYGKEFLSRDRN